MPRVSFKTYSAFPIIRAHRTLFQNSWIIISPALRTAFNFVKYSRALVERDFEAPALSTTHESSAVENKKNMYQPKDVQYYAVSAYFIIPLFVAYLLND